MSNEQIIQLILLEIERLEQVLAELDKELASTSTITLRDVETKLFLPKN